MATYRANKRYPVSADVAADELCRIEEKFGALKSAHVVSESRPNSAPLHPIFEWNDKKAAEAYRNNQARTLIRAVEIQREPNQSPSPIYVHVGGSKPSYQRAEVVVRDIGAFALAVAEMHRRVSSAQRALEQLREIADQESADPDQMQRVALAIKAFEAARVAAMAIH